MKQANVQSGALGAGKRDAERAAPTSPGLHVAETRLH
jgi:hypothetical protein